MHTCAIRVRTHCRTPTELSELKSFVTDTDRLCVIADLGERIGRTVSCPRSEIASRSSSWFESIFTMRDRDPERLTSSLRDAIALEYLSHLNQQLNPEHLIVLLSHSGTLIKLSKDLRISGVAQNGYAPPAVMDLATLLFYMSNMSVAGANMTMDLDATRVVLRQLRQAGEYLMEQRSLVEKASQERSADEPRQAFLRGATSARLGDLLEAVQQREDHELALRSIPLLQKYVRRAERAAHHVRRARTRSISQFLGLLAKSETVKAKMRKEAKDLVETMSVVSQSLSSIARVGRLDLQHIDDTSIKGYSPVFSNRSMQAIYHDIVDRLAGTQNLHAVFNSLADAYEVYSDDPEMHVLMGYVLLKHNDNRSAVREMTEAHRKLPNSPDVCLLLILALRICQDWSAAWSVLDTLLHAAVPKRLRPFLLREKALLLYKTNPRAVAEAIQINEEARTAANGIKEAALVEPWLLNNEAYLRAKAYQATSDLACLRRADQALTVLLELSDEKRWIPPFFHTSCLVGRLCGTEFPNLDKTQACNRLETAIRHGELAASANDSSEEAVTDYRLARDAAKAAGCDFADW